MGKKELLILVGVLIAAIAVINEIALYFHLFFQLWWFDAVLHFLGGVWVAFAALWVYFFSDYIKKRQYDSLTTFAVPILAVFFIGLLWELFEVIIGTPVAVTSYDTVKDLIMDTLGGFAAHAYFINYARLTSTHHE